MPSVNVALAANGGVASASTFQATWPPSRLGDGIRNSDNWLSGFGWASDSGLPQWAVVTFSAPSLIGTVNTFTYTGVPGEPTLATVSDGYGIKDFTVEYWDGGAWVVIETVTNNNKVWRQFTFTPVTTDKVRVHITAGMNDAVARMIEIEAWTAEAAGGGGLGSDLFVLLLAD